MTARACLARSSCERAGECRALTACTPDRTIPPAVDGLERPLERAPEVTR